MDTTTITAARAMPWNKGKLLGGKPPLKLKEIWAIRIRLQLDHRTRELALFNLAVDSKLRGCDLVALRVHHVVQGNPVAPRAIVMQKKTQWPVQFEIAEQTRDAVAAWIAMAHLKPDQFLSDRPGADLRDRDLASNGADIPGQHRGTSFVGHRHLWRRASRIRHHDAITTNVTFLGGGCRCASEESICLRHAFRKIEVHRLPTRGIDATVASTFWPSTGESSRHSQTNRARTVKGQSYRHRSGSALM